MVREKKLKSDILKQIGVIKYDVIKNPRFLDMYDIGMEVFKYWHEVYPKFRVILMQRAIKFTVMSYNRVKTKQITNVEIEVVKRQKNWDLFCKYLKGKNINHIILNFPDFLNDYESFYSRISSLRIDFDKEKGNEIWKKMVDFNKVHFNK